MARINWDEVIRQCRASGLKVIEIPGWKSRGRPGSHSPKGVVCHHTGGSSNSRSYVEWMALTGRPEDGIPAPLCQLALDRNGTVYMCAAGRANHAGRTRSIGGWLRAGDGNSQTVGIEAMNTGSEGWGAKQYDAYVLLCAILCRVQRWPASHVVGHKETSLTGKWDPGGMSMSTLRSNVAKAIKGGGSTPPPKPKEWDEMATKKELQDAFLDALTTERGQGVQANAVAAALRDGPVARRELAEIVSEEVMVKNPVTGELWPLKDALWSLWHYAYQAGANASKPPASASAHVTIAKAPAREAAE